MIQRWTIRARVLFLALVPPLLLGTVLAIYFINTRVSDLRQQQTDLGRALVEQLASAAEYGVFTSNDRVLNRLTRSVAAETDVSKVIILDRSGRELARQTRTPDRQSTPPVYRWLSGLMRSDREELRFEAPIVAGEVDLGDVEGLFSSGNADESESRDRQIGTAIIQLSAYQVAVRQAEVVAKGFAITVGGLMLTLLLAIQVSRRLTRPLRRMIATVNRFRDGDLSARVREDSGGELGSLQHGINAMADAVARSREEMQSEIDNATVELRETLEAVEVKNVELDLARKRAMDANRVKSEFLANMSHEIRTPMNAVLGFTDLLKDTELNATQREYARTIDESASTLLGLLENILDLSRIEAGRLHAERIPFELRQILENVIDDIADHAYEKNLELIFRMEPDRPVGAIGDENKIRQILVNLLDNAIKFTDRGFVRLAVQVAEDRTTGAATAHFHVQDTGPGIPEDFRDRLFEAFSQADTSITREHGGAGLGLALCRQLTRLMGGEISLETQPDQGTIFHLSIPLELQPSFREPADTTRPLDGKRIALYETSDESAEALHHRLYSLGATVTRFRRLDRLAQEFSERRVDLPGPKLVILALSYVELRHPENLYTIWRGVPTPPRQIVLANTRDKSTLQRIARIVGAPCLPKQTDIVRLQREIQQAFDGGERKLPGQAESGRKENGMPPETAIPEGPESAGIVVVDDNRINRELAARHLRELGRECRILASGRELITLLRSHCPELVLIDIRMAGLSGPDTIERIRATRLCPHTRFIALTAHASEDETSDFLSMGFDGVITKPFTRSDLEEVLSPTRDTPRDAVDAGDPNPKETPDESLNHLDPEIRTMLAEDLPDNRMRCRSLMETSDWAELKSVVHDVHGTAAFCNIEPLRRTARAFEITLDKGVSDDIELQAEDFFRELDTIVDILERE